MRALMPLTFGLLLAQAALASPPNLLGQELKVILIDPVSLRARDVHESRTLSRFASGNLFLSSPDRAEYLYGNVSQQEPLRFTSGHKTFLFDSPEHRRATFVHVYTDEVRVSHASCNRT